MNNRVMYTYKYISVSYVITYHNSFKSDNKFIFMLIITHTTADKDVIFLEIIKFSSILFCSIVFFFSIYVQTMNETSEIKFLSAHFINLN